MKMEKEMKIRRSSIHPVSRRIEKLREESITKKVKISSERARLITEFYKNNKSKEISPPVKRAMAFKYLMEHVSLPIEEGQLIVGLRGTGVKEVPTYPEVCCHSLKDLDVLTTREKNPYVVDGETKKLYEEEIIPYWKGKTMREHILHKMSEEWEDAYNAGVFTEFMEQRVPGHTAGGERVFTKGLIEIKQAIKEKKRKTDSSNEKEELKAMEIAADAMIIYARRYTKKLERMVEEEENERRKKELKTMAKICRRVPAHAPQTFREALQHYWFVHVGVVTESNPWDSFTPGRLDHYLYPSYKKDIKENRLTKTEAKELLEALWLKFNAQPAPPKVGVTAEESNTYNDFAKINIGGVKRDGTNAVNEVSYLLLEVLEEMRTVQPNTAVLISKKTPEKLLMRALDVVKPGFGEPPFFSHDGITKILLRQGKSLEDARMGGVSGCVETGAFGKECYILTGYFNLIKILEITLHNGTDPRTKKKVGIETGDPSTFEEFNDLFTAFTKQLKYFIDIKIKGNDTVEKLYAEQMPVPFLSFWIDDCVHNAEDYNGGGARYNTQYIQIVGLGTVTDALTSLRYNVFKEERVEMTAVVEALNNNYEGKEEMRQMFLHKTPKYGNDDGRADTIAKKVFRTCIDLIESYPRSPVRKASKRVYGLPTTVHVYFGSVCNATPDGRKAGEPVSEGISPVQGADKKGIGAVFQSVTKLDHTRSGGTLLNQKLSPDLVQDEKILRKLGQLMRAYFTMGAHHVQYNVVSADLLRHAQENPEAYQNLMVRVAGYSDYFVNLPKGLQDEIIRRTEQKNF